MNKETAVKLRQNFPGQSLIEVVIALGVVVALAVSLVTTSLITQRSSQQAKNNTQATKLVLQSIEKTRVFRDRVGFSSLANGSCWVLVSSDADPLNWSLSNTSPNTCPETIVLNQTSFTRTIAIANGSNANQKRITVTVSWTDSGGAQSVSNSTILSDCITTSDPC